MVKDSHSNNDWLLPVALLLGVGLFLLFTRKPSGTSQLSTPLSYSHANALVPHARQSVPDGGLVTYKNLETWDIEWNADGLPAKVSIHREAKRLD